MPEFKLAINLINFGYNLTDGNLRYLASQKDSKLM